MSNRPDYLFTISHGDPDKTYEGKACVKCEKTKRYKSNQGCVACLKRTAKNWKYKKIGNGVDMDRVARRRNAEMIEEGIIMDRFDREIWE